MNTNIHILIVEDETLTSRYIETILLSLDYQVSGRVKSYASALNSIKNQKPDLVLIDITLKGEKNGIDLATAIRNKYAIPFIYLTANKNPEILDKAVTTKASTYLNKPVRKDELQSNIAIALHKIETKNKCMPLNNGYLYDTVTRDVYYEKKLIPLGYRLKSFLEVLVLAKGEIVPFNVIEEHVWGSKIIFSDNALRNILYQVKQKMNINIKVIPSVGYKLVLDITN